MIGERIGNHRIVSLIGEGGMGTVYQAEDTHLGRTVAIKVLKPSLASRSSVEMERFLAEAKVQANLNHPNIATLHELQPLGDSYCMIMEYVKGSTLAYLVRSVGAMPHPVVVSIAKQVLEGLAVAHSSGVVHRDLKPSNIMLTPGGIAKVMDFGIAKVEGGKSLTATGALVGTVYYMSPEQVRGERVDARSDIYSLGIILFELLTGSVPFKEESDFSIMIHHVQTPPPPLTQLLPEVPSDLERIVLRCLHKDPGERYQRAEEIHAELDSFEEQERALGRGTLYARAALARWLSSPEGTQAESGSDKDRTGSVAGAPRTEETVPHIAAPHAGNEAPGSRDLTATPPIPEELRRELAAQGPPAGTRKGLVFLLLMFGIVLLAGAGVYSWMAGGRGGEPIAQETQSAAVGPAQPGIPEVAEQEKPGGPGDPAAGIPSGLPADPKRPPGGFLREPAALSGGSASSQPIATPLEGSAPVSQPPAAVPAAQLPSNFLIFVDAEQSSERLPLALAQGRAADIVRESGQKVASGGVVSGAVRAALDAGNLTEVRRHGVGYVVLGTAGGSLEPQTAYGSTYYVGKVSVRFELVRISDGSIAATGSSSARSRGTANPDAALQEAMLGATSAAAREMMRRFEP